MKKVIILQVLILNVLWPSKAAETAEHSAIFHSGFISGRNSTRAFIVLVDVAVKEEEIYMGISASSISKCKSQCWTSLWCSTFSFDDKNSECRLSKSKPHQAAMVEGGHFFGYFIPSSTKWTGVRLTDDGFLYFFVKEEMTFSDARYECLRYPGFHLPIITLSQQYNNAIFRDHSFWLGLELDSSSNAVWEIGIAFKETTAVTGQELQIKNEIIRNFYFDSGKFFASSSDMKRSFYCQSNLQGLPWLETNDS